MTLNFLVRTRFSTAKRPAAVRLLAAALGACFSLQPAAAPFKPDRDDQVLERLPAGGAEKRALQKLRENLAAAPSEAEARLDLAERCIAVGKAEADPRYYGYAEGLLAVWNTSSEPPIKALLLRAQVRQHRHDFKGALQDLNALLRRDPENAQGWLTQAVIQLVQARYPEALNSCARLINTGDALVAGTCLALVNSLLGQAQKSYDFLSDILNDEPQANTEERQWALTVLADMADRLNRPSHAEKHYAEAVAMGRPNVSLYGAYADFLLDRGQPQKVLELLQGKERIDTLFLRSVLALRRLGSPNAAAATRELEARFEAGRLRGENLHPGDEARFRLEIMDQPETALRLAQANWQVQREPKDARVLLAAAAAAKEADAANPVLALLAATRMENPTLRELAERIAEQR